jgi:hypothetical protein
MTVDLCSLPWRTRNHIARHVHYDKKRTYGMILDICITIYGEPIKDTEYSSKFYRNLAECSQMVRCMYTHMRSETPRGGSCALYVHWVSTGGSNE